MLEKSVGQRLRQAREQLGWSQQDVGRRAGVDPNMIYQYESGHRNPSRLALRGLASLYGKPVEWFFAEEEEEPSESPDPSSGDTMELAEFRDAIQRQVHDGEVLAKIQDRIESLHEDWSQLAATLKAGEAREAEVVTEARARYGDQGDPHSTSEAKVVPMTQYMKPTFASYARAAAGPDEPVFDEATELRYAFHKSLFPKWAQEKHLLCIEAVGNSMEPTLHEGDLIVLDRSKIEPISGQIFVVRTPDGLVVKRLKRAGRTWRLVSDNPAYPPRSVSREDRVLGRVAWSGPQPVGR